VAISKETPVSCVNKSPEGGLPFFLILSGAFLILLGSGCGAPSSASRISGQHTDLASSRTSVRTSSTVPVLLYNGTGTSSNDVKAVESVLSTLRLPYSTADASQIEGMSESELAAHRLLIVPGGNSIAIGDNLSHDATTKIHDAVVNDGLHYLGICAGAFFGGYSIYNGLNLTDGVWFNFYADEFKGIHKAAVTLSFANDTTREMYWQDGPQLSGWGEIVAKYPDGVPAMVEGKSGRGWVILSGVHAEAPATWRTGMKFKTPVATDQAYAGTLITAALAGSSLPHF